MDIRDFLYKIDAIQNKEQMKADVKRTHIKEASQVMLYGDTPADMAAIAQIFRNAGITPPPAIAIGPKPEESVAEDITNKGKDFLMKAGFDPMKVQAYMSVFNDHGDTSDIKKMNMEKVGLADAMSMVLASHDIENESAVAEQIPGKANTTPEPEYQDTQYMTKDLSGGANKIKKMYRKEYPGDNPMAVEDESAEQDKIKEALKQAYLEKKAQSPYAIGMAKAMQMKGDTPPLKKSTIKKAHDIAKAIKKDK